MVKKILLLIVIVLAAVFLFNFLLAPAASKSQTVFFEVKTGQSVKDVAKNLKTAGLIKSPLAFELYVRFRNDQNKIIAGGRYLDVSWGAVKILDNLKSAKDTSNERTVTLIEGWRAADMAAYLESQGLFDQGKFLVAIKTDRWRTSYDFLSGVKAATIEGFIFPDTYRIFKTATPEDIIKKALDNFGAKLTPEMRQEIARQGKTIFEVVTLASIVEREAQTGQDKALVADVFLKRLAQGLGLQSDATVNYITGKKDLRPSAADLAIDSPYNTYKYRGLPPGPISNPGLVAIKAVIYPQKNDYYYFLMDKNGQTHYAKTYAEHQQNIKKYLD